MGSGALSVDDRLAILDLAARYNHLMDWQDAAGWADCFTPDGVFDAGPRLQATGRAELVAFMERLIARDRPARHWTNSVVIEAVPDAPDKARMTLYLLVVDLTSEGPEPRNFGIYHDELVRTDGGWRFQVRRLGHR